MDTKSCPRCGKSKPTTEFVKDLTRQTGLQSVDFSVLIATVPLV